MKNTRKLVSCYFSADRYAFEIALNLRPRGIEFPAIDARTLDGRNIVTSEKLASTKTLGAFDCKIPSIQDRFEGNAFMGDRILRSTNDHERIEKHKDTLCPAKPDRFLRKNVSRREPNFRNKRKKSKRT